MSKLFGAGLCLALAVGAGSSGAAPWLRLNEVMSSDNASFADEDGAYEDWIELLNAGDAAASLEGWGLSDDAAVPLKWTFPALTLQPGEHLLVWASGKDRRPPGTAAQAPLVIVPTNSAWSYRDNGLAPDAGWAGPAFDASGWASGPAMLGYNAPLVKTPVSFGTDGNNKYPATYFRLAFESPVAAAETHGPGVLRLWVDDGAVIYLNGEELARVRMPAGEVTYQTLASDYASGGNGQWEAFEVPLAALRLGVNVLAAEVHQRSVSSSDLCFWLELSVRLAGQHTNFKLSAGNEPVVLSAPDGGLADSAPALSVLRDSSYGRQAGDPGGAFVMFPFPTPGTTNGALGYAGLLSPPTFSVAPGFYEAPVTVTLAHDDPAAQVFYTLDGSTPTNAVTSTCFRYAAPLALADRSSLPNRLSMIRTNPIEMESNTQYGWMPPGGLVPKCTVVRAMAFRNGYFSPRGAAGTWLIGGATVQHTVRVCSLLSDEANLFGDPLGIMVPGDIYKTLGWNGHYVGLPNANYFQYGDAWERPVFLQLFEADRTLAVSQLMGARNHGAWSRGAAQKTLLLYAREEYGDSKVKYPLFPNQPADNDFKRFLLRNSGNDWSSTGFRDAMMQQIFRTAVRTDTQDYTPTVVYVNGEYWGLQNIREHYSKYYLERKHGVDPENLDFLKAQVGTEAMEIQEGDELDYKEVLDYVKTNDLSRAEHYAWVERRMDLDNLIEHYACEIYCCNTDWPGNNLGVWRVRTAFNPAASYGNDGRWRWLMYDTDHGFGHSSSEWDDMMFQARRSGRGVCQPQFDRLLANADFRNRFVNRFADLMNTAFQPARVQGIIQATASRVESEMPRHIARWGRMGSLAAWQANVQRLRDFANNRPAPALANIVNEFGLGGTARLTLDITNGAGRVTVNTLTIDAATLGLPSAARPYPWSGTYFMSVPVVVTAVPDEGFEFVRWETASGAVADQTLALTLTGDTSLTAVFEATVLPSVTVNEVMADATLAGGFLHPVTGAAADWLELFNNGPGTVDLGGYWLADSQAASACPIPAGVTLPPGGCLLVWTGSDLTPGRNADGSLNASFGLGKNGDAVALIAPDRSRELDRVTFGSQSTNTSQGRWRNGASGGWVSFAKPTPGLPNRNPAMTAGLLPLYPVQAVAVGSALTLSFAPAAPVTGGVYALTEGQAGAAVNSAGQFAWTPPVTLGSGVYAFRLTLMGLLDGQAVTDETTLLVAVSNTQRYRIDTLVTPAQGGTVLGGGVFVAGATVALTAVGEPLWNFVKWSDGVTAVRREFTARRDVTYTATFAYGLDTPSGAGGTVEAGLPLLYWRAVPYAEGYVVRRAPTRAGPFAEIGMASNNVFYDTEPLVGVEVFYTVAARHSETESPASAAFQAIPSGVTRKLTGAVNGSLGSYGNNPSVTRDKVFDGDIASFYDAAADGGWPGLDFGTVLWRRLAYLRYVPRDAFPGRMVNGLFQTASVSDGIDTFESPVTLHQITSSPPAYQYTTVTLGSDWRFRYLRYLPPPDGWGNIAELEVYGYDAVPPVPPGLAATAGVDRVTLTWGGVTNCGGYFVRRATGAEPFAAVAYVESAGFEDRGLAAGTAYRYRVAAVNGSGVSADGADVLSLTEVPLTVPLFTAGAAGGAGVERTAGAVTLRLSGVLDPRLELVCSDTLEVPVAGWPAVSNAAFSGPEAGSGIVTVSIATNAPRLFFAVRVKR